MLKKSPLHNVWRVSHLAGRVKVGYNERAASVLTKDLGVPVVKIAPYYTQLVDVRTARQKNMTMSG